MKKLYGTAEYTKLTKYNFRIFVKLQMLGLNMRPDMRA